MLSDIEILQAIQDGDICIVGPMEKPLVTSISDLETHGYDLRAKEIYLWGERRWIDLEEEKEFVLKPGGFVVIKTYERICLSPRVAGTLHSMARKTLLGLNHISTTVHPGWGFSKQEGKHDPQPFLIAVHNWGRADIPIKYKQKFCRMLFHRVGEARGSAPALDEVSGEFDVARRRLEKRYGTTVKMKGGLLMVGVVASGILLSVVLPKVGLSAAITSAVVASIFSFLLPIINSRYHVL